jgi:dynein heavy chain
MAYIETLPTEDTPQTYGLHENANITFYDKETRALLDTLVSLEGGSGGGSQDSSGTDKMVMDSSVNVLSKLPEKFDKIRAHPDTFAKIADGSINSMGVFLGQEMIRFNRLMNDIQADLLELQKAIKGVVVMSPGLEKMYNCFIFQQIPDRWGEHGSGYPCLKPLGSFLEDLFLRLVFVETWLTTGPPVSFWISGFFFPQGFMTGIAQTHSRKTKIAVDSLMPAARVLEKNYDAYNSAPQDGAYVHGLFMQGARFDRSSMLMAESEPSVLFDVMPVIWIEPVVAAEYAPSEVYHCPLYKTSLRAGTLSTTGHSTNFVAPLDIPSKQTQTHWIRRGVALLCMLDD